MIALDDLLFTDAAPTPARKPLSAFPACERCGLYKGCASPKLPVRGKGARRIMIVSDSPGKHDDRQGEHFSGPAGRVLIDHLDDAGVNLDRDCWALNALACAPDGKPDADAVLDCRPNVMRAIRTLDPVVVILAGPMAVRSVIGHLWKEKVGPVSRWAGLHVPSHGNYWVCPTYNPAAMLYEDVDPVVKLEFADHVARACKLTERPWQRVPNYPSMVDVVFDPDDAAERLRAIRDCVIAFDYETTCSKPDGPGSAIVCCSVSDGHSAFAFPFVGRAIDALRDVLTDPGVHKIASNLDMEDRWTRKHLGVEVASWKWDTMLTAHAISPRGKEEDRKSDDGITGLKFQAFALLGQGDYSSHVEPFLVPSEKGGYNLNRVRECDPHALYHYCGMDSLLEYHVADRQASALGLSLE